MEVMHLDKRLSAVDGWSTKHKRWDYKIISNFVIIKTTTTAADDDGGGDVDGDAVDYDNVNDDDSNDGDDK